MEAPVVYFKILTQHLHGKNYENHAIPISGLRFEPPRYEMLHCNVWQCDYTGILSRLA